MKQSATDCLVTATGLTTSAGSRDATWASLCAGQSALVLDPDSGMPMARMPASITGWPDTPVFADIRKYAGRASALAIGAVAQLLAEYDIHAAGLDPARAGIVAVVEGDSNDLLTLVAHAAVPDERSLAVRIYDDLPDFHMLRTIPVLATQWLGLQTGFTGGAFAVIPPAVGGLAGIAQAMALIASEELDRVLVVASRPMPSPETVTFYEQRAYATHERGTTAGPFSAGPSRWLLGEGAAAIMLESRALVERRHGHHQGWLCRGETVVTTSLAEAYRELLTPWSDIASTLGAIWAHGAMLTELEATEAAALHGFGQVPITATKGAIGHLFGASAVTDLVLATRARAAQLLPPVVGTQTPSDVAKALNLVLHEPRALLSGGTQLILGTDAPFQAGVGAMWLA